MSKMEMYATVIGVFEMAKDRLGANDWVLTLFSDDDVVSKLVIQEYELTQWSDPTSNREVVVGTEGGEPVYKYTLRMSMRFNIEGDYGAAQHWLVERLMRDEELSYMNIQQIRLSGAEIGENFSL